MFLHISSDQCQDLFPENSSSSFKVKLPRTLYFPKNECWFISLVDIKVPRLKDSPSPPYVLVSTPLCDPSIVGQQLIPVLYRFYESQISRGKCAVPANERQLAVTTDQLSVIEVHITNPSGQNVSFRPGKSYLTLRLTRKNV